MTLTTYHISTLGCQMNKADSEQLGAELERLGLAPVSAPDGADVVVVNTCVVRQSAEDRAVGQLHSLKGLKRARPDAVVALMGCMVDARTDLLRARFPHVDAFMRPQQFEPLLNLLSERGVGTDDAPLTELGPETLPGAARMRPGVASYVPVIHGCDEMCTYCIVPFRRGRERSRPVAAILDEVSGLVKRGVREVTLLGQIVDAYGHDLPERPTLAELLRLTSTIAGVERVRFLTSHPRFMSDDLVAAVAALPKVCEHINLPFQAGDDAILRRMRRTYTVDWYRALVARIRGVIAGVALSTDVIVGFSGETEAAFARTYDLLSELRFDVVHVAAYSPRPGTYADRRIPDDVPPEAKRERLHAVEDLQRRIAQEINGRLVGTVQEVLVETREKGRWRGRTRADRLVFFDDATRNWLGQLALVQVVTAGPWSLQGTIARPEREGAGAHGSPAAS